jgi:hypothetical protein
LRREEIMREEVVETIRRHFPELKAELVYCSCGLKFLSSDTWSMHLAEELELLPADAQE